MNNDSINNDPLVNLTETPIAIIHVSVPSVIIIEPNQTGTLTITFEITQFLPFLDHTFQ